MIHTITPNPALDTCGVVDRITTDEKNYIHDVVRFPGGNGINVSRILTRLKIPCVASGFLGGGMGEVLLEALRHERVRCDFVPIQGMTRQSVTVTQVETGCQTRLSFPGPTIRRSEVLALEKKTKAIQAPSILMCGGSLPEGYSVQTLSKLLKSAASRGLSVVIDCPGPLLKTLIKTQPVLIKPNLVEFQQLMGEKLKSRDDVLVAAQSLLGSVQMICVSSVDGGALLVTRQGSWYGKGKKIKACSTVGAGDSMVAGMISQFEKVPGGVDDDLAPEMLRWGIAAGMATAFRPTGYLGQASDIRNFKNHVRIKRISSL